MKNIFILFFAGSLFILMSLQDDSGNIIPSEIKLIIGIVFVVYGIYLIIKRKRNAR
jgi:hypothetical protein